SFFLYMPVSSKFYRTVMYGLHNGNENMRYNLKGHNYYYEFKKHHKENDCNQAIESAENSFKYFMLWIEQDHNSFKSQVEIILRNINKDGLDEDLVKKSFRWLINQTEFYQIEGTIETLYDAYLCKADSEKDSGNYQNAIDLYQKTLLFSYFRNNSSCWKNTKAYAFDDLAYCHRKLGNFAESDSLYNRAVLTYRNIENYNELYVAVLFKEWSYLYREFEDYDVAKDLLKIALNIYKKNPEAIDYEKEMYLIREQLVLNYIGIDSLQQAFSQLE